MDKFVPCNHIFNWKDFSCCQRKVCIRPGCGKILMGESRPLVKVKSPIISHAHDRPGRVIVPDSKIIIPKMVMPEMARWDARYLQGASGRTLGMLRTKAGVGSFVGGGVPAASDPCTTGTATSIAAATDDGNSRDFNTYVAGQSITVDSAEPFYSITLYQIGVTGGGLVTCRIGTTTDLSSSYTDQVSITMGTAEAAYTGISSTCPNLVVGTMYIACNTATDLGLNFGITDTNPYAGGSYYYGSSHSFSVPSNISGRDLAFEVKVRR
jgi:FlaG/FlaF family flagellin (archaellin)